MSPLSCTPSYTPFDVGMAWLGLVGLADELECSIGEKSEICLAKRKGCHPFFYPHTLYPLTPISRSRPVPGFAFLAPLPLALQALDFPAVRQIVFAITPYAFLCVRTCLLRAQPARKL